MHAFVAYSRVVYEKLRAAAAAPPRHHFPAAVWRHRSRTPPVSPPAVPLRLIFVGRLDEAKGVGLLPEIDRRLRLAGVAITWTIVGTGPAGPALHAAWHEDADTSAGWRRRPPATCSRLCASHDVFVLPSHAEGLSVATVEAMSAGLVPVVSDLTSMVELVDQERTGRRAGRRRRRPLPTRSPAWRAIAIVLEDDERRRAPVR